MVKGKGTGTEELDTLEVSPRTVVSEAATELVGGKSKDKETKEQDIKTVYLMCDCNYESAATIAEMSKNKDNAVVVCYTSDKANSSEFGKVKDKFDKLKFKPLSAPNLDSKGNIIAATTEVMDEAKKDNAYRIAFPWTNDTITGDVANKQNAMQSDLPTLASKYESENEGKIIRFDYPNQARGNEDLLKRKQNYGLDKIFT